MEKLDKIIFGKGEVKDFIFEQVHMSDKAYMYKVESGVSTYYEVFRRMSKTNSKRDCFPSSKAFGVWAWTIGDKSKALRKFNELSK